MLPINSIISNTLSWTPLLIRPRKSLENIVECFRFYDASVWNANLELFESGLKLGMDILLPALLLSLVGSILPTSVGVGGPIPVGGFPPFLDAFSPYTSHSSALSSSPRSRTPYVPKYPFLTLGFDLNYLMRCIALSIASPIAIDLLLHNFAPILIQAFSRLRVVLLSHKGPDASTKVALSKRVQTGRAICRRAYDLYFPPKSVCGPKIDCITSLLFFPGFGVHHSAYADVCAQISDYGIPVVVVSLEPLRLAHKNLGGGIEDVRRLIQLAGDDLVQYYKQLQDDRNISFEWALGGHSMGGYNALQLAEVLQANSGDTIRSVMLKDGSISRIGSDIVAWASGTTALSFPDLSSSSFRVFILLATNDAIARISSRQQKQQIVSKLPKRTKLVKIKGGNHSGFASYDDASSKSGTTLVNGPRHITLESQQKEASSLTASFLLYK